MLWESSLWSQLYPNILLNSKNSLLSQFFTSKVLTILWLLWVSLFVLLICKANMKLHKPNDHILNLEPLWPKINFLNWKTTEYFQPLVSHVSSVYQRVETIQTVRWVSKSILKHTNKNYSLSLWRNIFVLA